MVESSSIANDEDADTATTITTVTVTGMASSDSSRQPLGTLSPNVGQRSFSRPDKTMVSSPLKRAYTAAIDSDQGFKYFKRRRATPGAMLRSTTDVELNEKPVVFDEVASFRHAAREVNDDLPPLVSSQAPADEGLESECRRDRDSSSERHSFSSLINYDPSSQHAHLSQQSVRPLRDTEPNTSISSSTTNCGSSQAELLRLRLRVAMYKVETDQVHTPFDYLRERTANGLRESSRAVLEAVEQLRSEAREVMLRAQQHGTTSTSYGSADLGAEERACIRLPSSPLPSDPVPAMRNVLTPKAPVHVQAETKELTSSAVKSHVAEGLLGMRNAL